MKAHVAEIYSFRDHSLNGDIADARLENLARRWEVLCGHPFLSRGKEIRATESARVSLFLSFVLPVISVRICYAKRCRKQKSKGIFTLRRETRFSDLFDEALRAEERKHVVRASRSGQLLKVKSRIHLELCRFGALRKSHANPGLPVV